ncbi:hypothetical protein SUDANB105_04403 [Streptomyces sp. enrichment culture]|uniref:hypothetical protein n=1 Tax=Streptomyces sp. enrichment culture TaxID=1795815 RepID=UPI003F549A89
MSTTAQARPGRLGEADGMTMTPVLQQPPTGPKRRPKLAITVVPALVLALAAGGLALWRAAHDGEDGPLAGRPRVKDTAAGLSYALPEGWKRSDGDLIDSFTSSITHEHTGGEGGSVVLAGRGGAVPDDGLKMYTERWARSNAEFFYPDGGSTVTRSEPTTTDGRPAHTVALRVADEEGSTGHLRLTVIAVDDTRTAFLLTVVQPATAPEDETADAVLESAAVL